MIDNPDFRLSDRPVMPPGQVPFYRKFAKQILLSIVASMIAGAIINGTSLIVAVKYVSALVTRVLGDPWDGTKGVIHELEDKAHQTIERTPTAVVPLAPVSLNPLRATPAELEARDKLKQEAQARKEEEQRKSLIARADAVGLKHEEDWTLEKFKVEVPRAEDKFQLAEERKPLLAQARELKMVVDEDWDNKMLKAEILEERMFQKADATYQEQRRQYQEALTQREKLIARGPNARCPQRGCGHSFHTKRTKGEFICPKCRGIFPVTQAKACHTPPPMPKEPFPPQRKVPGLLRRAFG